MTEWVYYGTMGKVYHTDPTCHVIKKINQPLRASVDNVPIGRYECRHCSGKALSTGPSLALGPNAEGPGTCRSCGHRLDRGACPWCAEFDAKHNLPREYDIEFGRTFAGASV